MIQPSTSWRTELDTAIDTAWAAARLIQPHAGRVKTSQIQEKVVHDLVTELDLASQKLIQERLVAAFPDDRFLGEESGEDDFEAYRTGRVWIVDPIDGTTNFTHGLPPYAISIGLVEDGAPKVGVVLDVSQSVLYTATAGGGAYRNGQQMQVSSAATLDESVVLTGFPARAIAYMALYMEIFEQMLRRCRGVRRPGCASVDLAYVADGVAEAFYETGISPWDMAAGILLVTEAGGQVTDNRGASVNVLGRQLVASNGHIHAALLEQVASMKDVFS
ncbi:MAG: inositol monophosphatase family protein [Rhodothermales bacterium]